MIQNIIKSRRDKTVTIKVVLGSEQEADDLKEELEERIDLNAVSIEKMQLLYTLLDVKITTVLRNVFIIYNFENTKDSKQFEINFVKNIEENGRNLTSDFLITQKEESNEKEDDQYVIKLKLPLKAIDAIANYKELLCVTMESEPSCPIYKDMACENGHKVKIEDKNIDKPIINISFYHNGTRVIRSVPQRWLDIEEITYKAVVNTEWALNSKNIIAMKDGGIVSKYNNKEIFTSMDIIKMDSLTVKLNKHEDGFIDSKSGLVFAPEHLIMK